MADYFLRVDGIPGESNDAKHKGEIEVLSWSWGEVNEAPPRGPGGGAGAGKVDMSDLTVTAQFSKASPQSKIILTALKKYGLILADNGSNWFISGAPDPRWNDDDLNTLKGIKGSNFEVVKMDNIITQ